MDDHEDSLHRARQAYAARDWRSAADSFDAVAPYRLTADDLAAYADAVWWLGRVEDALRLHAAACDALVAESRPGDAAGVAFRLGVIHVSRGDAPQGMGWLSRSKHLLEQWAGGIPALLRFLQHDMSYEGPRSTDPEALGQVAAPVLLLRGEQTLLGTFFANVERYVAQHVVDAHVRELPGVGHFAPLVEPAPIAKELISFFESRKVQRARAVVPPHAKAARG